MDKRMIVGWVGGWTDKCMDERIYEQPLDIHRQWIKDLSLVRMKISLLEI